LENSKEYKEALLSLRNAEIELKNARANYMMELDLNFNLPQLNWFQMPYYTPGIPYRFLYREEFQKYKGEIALNHPLPTGGSFTLSSGVIKSDYEHYYSLTDSQDEYTEYISDLNLALTQPVFRENLLRTNYRKAKLYYYKERNNFERRKNEIIFKVKTLYYNVISAQKTLEINRESVKQSEHILELAKEKLKSGIISKLDLLSAEVELMNSQSTLEEAKTSLFNASEELKAYLNLNLKTDYQFEVKIIQESELNMEMETLIDMALNYSPELKNIDYDKQISQIDRKNLRRQKLPNGLISAHYGYEGRGEDFSTSIDEFDKSRWSVMFTINVPVFDWGRINNQLNITENNIESLNLIYNEKVKGIELCIRSEFRNLESARTRLKINEKNLLKARENLELAQKRYEMGLIAIDSVQSAKINLKQAEFNLLKAKIDYNLAILRIKKQIGLNL
jgi:outer membrane protein TolC